MKTFTKTFSQCSLCSVYRKCYQLFLGNCKCLRKLSLNPILPGQIFWCFFPDGEAIMAPLFISVSVTLMQLKLSSMVPTTIKKQIKQFRS